MKIAHTVKREVGEAIRWLDKYSKPRPETTGDLEGDSYFQAAFNGAVDGLYVFGPVGAAFTAGSAAVGMGVRKATDNKALGIASAMASGAALAGLLVGVVAGGPVLVPVVTGALMGGYQVLRGDKSSKIRDAGNGSLLSAPFLPGPARMVGGMAGMMAAHCKTTKGKLAAGALTGMATAGALTLLVAGAGAVAPALLAGGLAGAVGPFFGPRFSQVFRNLAQDFGKPIDKLMQKLRPDHQPGEHTSKAALLAGTVPAAFVKEGIRGMVLSKGSLPNAMIGGAKEAIRQVHVVMSQKDPEPKPPQAK